MDRLSLHHDDHGYADAIDCNGTVLVHLRAGTERTVCNAPRLVREWNAMVSKIAKLERELANRCETCGARVYSGPPDCPRCGAPQCCTQCCKIDSLQQTLEDEAGKLERSAENLLVATASPSTGALSGVFRAMAKRMRNAIRGDHD